MADVERRFHSDHAPLVRSLTRRLGDREWADAVAQETFVRARRHGAADTGPSAARERAWLFAAATNHVMLWVRLRCAP